MKRIRASILAAGLLVLGMAPMAYADTNDFSFRSFEARYDLSRDSQNRSVLKVREDLMAVFPDFDQNHGIERAIPKSYDNHPVNLQIRSILNKQGNQLDYTTYGSNGNLVIRIGDANAYVHGQREYFIDYSAADVTKNLDTGDEFYWDVNGTGWQQPFDHVAVSLHLDPAIVGAFDGRTKCFTGAQGSTASNCHIDTQKTDKEIVITATAEGLKAGENLSIVAGFHAGTFARYTTPPTQTILWILIGFVVVVWYLVVPIIAFVKAFRRWKINGRDAAGRGTIVPQYTQPKGISVLLAGVIQDERLQSRAVSACTIDLAIRGYIKIYQVDKKNYELELTKDSTDLQDEEQAVIKMLFGDGASTGQKISLKDKKDLYTQVAKLAKTVYQRAINDGLMVDTRTMQRKMNIWGIVLLILSAFTLNILGVIAGVVVIVFAYKMPARTEKGVELKEYLLGVRDYMQLAEADRMKVLQSVEGAERINTDDNQQMVKFYEKLLPLAMLFGIEKSWAEQFAGLYAQPPEWYAGNWTTFNAAVFASSLGDFGTNTTTNSFSPPTSSSSSGFSGGGFSGGGGGGGGGGGW